jgi:GT2 family glycosyltransferase
VQPGPEGRPSLPLVSVIVDNYNYAAYLREAVDSALQQIWPAVEVVVVDDGSTDESREILEPYGAQITLIAKPNGGQASAFNAGFAASHGEFVVFLDSDDVLHPEHAGNVVRLLERHPEAAFAQFRLRVVDSDLRPVGTVVPPAHVRLPTGDVCGPVSRWELASCLAPGGALGFPRRTLERIFPLPEDELRKGADAFLVRAAALVGAVVSTDEVAADYRSHGQNDSNSDVLDLDYLRVAMNRQVACGRLLREFADTHGVPTPLEPLAALDPLFLTQRLASLRAEPHLHPFPADGRWSLLVSGLRAVRLRRDIPATGKLVHAAWFVAVAALPRRAAVTLATWLMFPISRGRAGAFVHVAVSSSSWVAARLRGLRSG